MSKRSGILVALIFAAAFFAGCGSTSSPSAPVDTVAPAAILDVQAQVVQGTIEVTWGAGSEADLAGYRVYRSANGAAATLQSFTATTTFVDTNVFARTSYRYEVSAVDQAGNESTRTATLQIVVQSGPPSRSQISD
jgi:fibronectin type 3 domain-containing protein